MLWNCKVTLVYLNMLVVEHTKRFKRFDIDLNSETITNWNALNFRSACSKHLLTVRSHATIWGITNLAQSNFKARMDIIFQGKIKDDVVPSIKAAFYPLILCSLWNIARRMGKKWIALMPSNDVTLRIAPYCWEHANPGLVLFERPFSN